MAQVNKRGSDSRFVSVFADSTPDVDITFMVPFLQRPTDHYIVGVDNLTISLSALGLLDDEVDPKNIIMQVVRRQAQAGATNLESRPCSSLEGQMTTSLLSEPMDKASFCL